MRKFVRRVADKLLMGVAKVAASLPDNDYFSAYTITNGTTNYLTRVKFPRVFGKRVMLHKIWRADSDREMHNHPWDHAISIILLGSYIEERLDLTSEMIYRAFHQIRLDNMKKAGLEGPALIAGSVLSMPEVPRNERHVKWFNSLYKEDFHKITSIDGPLWTLFIAGERVIINGVDWGFLNEETRELIPHWLYTAESGAQRV